MEKKEIKAQYQKKQRRVVLFGVLLHLGILLVVKYTPFFTENINSLLSVCGVSFAITIPKILMPIGISFYTLQAISYIFDVYREITPADKNLFRVALYMGFFPQIMEGPIARFSDTADDLYAGKSITFDNLKFGYDFYIFNRDLCIDIFLLNSKLLLVCKFKSELQFNRRKQ